MTMRYPDGSQLTVNLTIDVTPGYPVWVYYAFHLQDRRQRCIIRCDNAPHHPALGSFPDHKHLGPAETPCEADPPILSDILHQLQQHLRTARP